MALEVKVPEVEVVESMLTILYWNIISIYVHCYLRQELFTSQWSDVDQAHFFRFSLGLHQCYVTRDHSYSITSTLVKQYLLPESPQCRNVIPLVCSKVILLSGSGVDVDEAPIIGFSIGQKTVFPSFVPLFILPLSENASSFFPMQSWYWGESTRRARRWRRWSSGESFPTSH